MSDQHNIGRQTTRKIKVRATSEGKMAQYALCTPDNWGLRFSDADPQRKGQLAYPVARNYAKVMRSLLSQVRWGDVCFGPDGSTPTLTLEWPFDDDAKKALISLISPPMKAAITAMSPTGGGIPDAAIPMMRICRPGEIGSTSGNFTAARWSMDIDVSDLAALFHHRSADTSKVQRNRITPLRTFADTLYHESRHCQQAFWMYALVQQHPDNFPTLAHISKWPMAAADPSVNQAIAIVKLAAKHPLPDEPTMLASIKRMAVGQYLYTLNTWRNANYHPTFAPDPIALDDEINRAHTVAIDLLQNVGIGGTPIDVDRMVLEPNKCKYLDYTSRPWENDAFCCGDMATAYWDDESGLNLLTKPVDQCSRAYELADHANRLRNGAAGAAIADGNQ